MKLEDLLDVIGYENEVCVMIEDENENVVDHNLCYLVKDTCKENNLLGRQVLDVYGDSKRNSSFVVIVIECE